MSKEQAGTDAGGTCCSVSAGTNCYVTYAIRYYDCTGIDRIVGVSAQNEMNAVKRLVGSRCCNIVQIERTDIKPEYAQDRIEGFIDYTFNNDNTWMYT